MKDNGSLLTPKHVRAARALLAWKQSDLARAASVASSTIVLTSNAASGRQAPTTPPRLGRRWEAPSDPAFGGALLREGIDTMLAGDVGTGKAARLYQGGPQ